MPLEHQITFYSPSQDVVGIHIYDSRWVFVDRESYSAGAGNGVVDWFGSEQYLGVVGAGFQGMGTSREFG